MQGQNSSEAWPLAGWQPLGVEGYFWAWSLWLSVLEWCPRDTQKQTVGRIWPSGYSSMTLAWTLLWSYLIKSWKNQHTLNARLKRTKSSVSNLTTWKFNKETWKSPKYSRAKKYSAFHKWKFPMSGIQLKKKICQTCKEIGKYNPYCRGKFKKKDRPRGDTDDKISRQGH